MDINLVYQILDREHPYLSDDDRQELAIKIWQKQEQYNNEGPLGAWIYPIAKRFLIDKWRKNKHKDEVSFTNYQLINDLGELISTIDLTSEQLDPLEQMIAVEAEKELMDRIMSLPPSQRAPILQLINEGKYEGSSDSNNSTKKVNASRARKNLLQLKKEKKYNLRNLEDGTVYTINLFADAARIVGCTGELVRKAYKSGGLFYKKKWRIEDAL